MSGNTKDRNASSKALFKSVTSKTGRIRRRKVVLTAEAALNKINTKMPNMSRKNQSTQIYSFPIYDKCDSLVFFPVKFTSMLNSGDFSNLRRLMKTRFDKDCSVNLCNGVHIDISLFVRVFECVDQMRPDSIMCAHTTKIILNEICSVLYFKYTENRAIRAAVAESYPDQAVAHLCLNPDPCPDKFSRFLESKSEKEQRRILKIVQAEEKIIYGRCYLTLRVDDRSKLVTHFDMDTEFTSFRLV